MRKKSNHNVRAVVVVVVAHGNVYISMVCGMCAIEFDRYYSSKYYYSNNPNKLYNPGNMPSYSTKYVFMHREERTVYAENRSDG